MIRKFDASITITKPTSMRFEFDVEGFVKEIKECLEDARQINNQDDVDGAIENLTAESYVKYSPLQ